jgi:hypothetical protein
VLRWSSDGRQLAFAWNSTAIRVLDASAPDGNLITSSSLLAAIGTMVGKASGVICNASLGWQLIEGGHGVICGGSAHTNLPQTSGACTGSERTLVGFLQETKGGQGGVPMMLDDFETDCPAQSGDSDGAYIGWANADGSVVIGSLVWDGRLRFGVFRNGRFTPLPALPVSVPVPTGVDLLVIGGSGLLGLSVTRHAPLAGHSVIAAFHASAPPTDGADWRRLDIRRRDRRPLRRPGALPRARHGPGLGPPGARRFPARRDLPVTR